METPYYSRSLCQRYQRLASVSNWSPHARGFPFTIAPSTRLVDRSSPVLELAPALPLITLRDELASNFQNPHNLEDDSLFIELPPDRQRHNNLTPLTSPLYTPFTLSPTTPTTSSPLDIPLPPSPIIPLLQLPPLPNPNLVNPLNLPMAITMPARGERAAPIFDKSRPRELSCFFDDLEMLFTRAQVVLDAEKKKLVVYYADFETEQIWKTFPEFANVAKTYKDFKDAILVHYPDATGDYVYSLRDMDSLIGERQRLGIKTTNDLSEYHLHFLAITTWLIEKKQLSGLEQKRGYLRAFQPSLLAAVNNRLQMKFTTQHPNIPHDIQDVYEAARFTLQSSALTTQNYYAPAPSPAAPPVTILQRPAAPVTMPSPPIKTENIGALFSEFTKTIVDAMNKNLRGPPSNPHQRHERQVDCNMCGGPHYIKECPVVDEYITAGKVKRNGEGKVVLPSGIYCPRDIPGTLLHERIDEWHRRFPNQLAVVSLIHTIAPEQHKHPLHAQAFSSYQLSTDDRIATLEAELFNLRARRPIPTTTIRTRAQRARDQAQDEPFEESRPTATARSATPDVPMPVAPPIVIVEETIGNAGAVPEPEHPYQKAKDASYAPPASRNVGAPAKAPLNKKPDPAYKTLPPVHDASIATEVYKRSMETPITITQRELLSLSPEVRSQVRDVTTTRRIPNNPVASQPALQSFIVEIDEEEEEMIPAASTFAFQNALHRTPPEGAIVVPDPIEVYYNSLKPGQAPDLDRLTVAKESTAIRSVFALVANSQKIECTVDPGCQIIAMAQTECHSLGLAYDPRIRLNMESANGTFDWSLGLARNVPFLIGDITLYFQVHVIKSPSYAVLLGRPFDVLTESVIRNFANEDQTITITDPNSGKKCTIPTFPRGSHCSHVKQDFRQ